MVSFEAARSMEPAVVIVNLAAAEPVVPCQIWNASATPAYMPNSESAASLTRSIIVELSA